jgi:aspartyl-tRNA(Asn)/glutamyl-tRNA(Gln) amidotransferase subunit B
VGGYVEINVGGQTKKIGITRAHLEEDAGKNTHPDGADFSLVDLNRAGTPLLEIVSEPDMHSAAEAKAYARELYLLMKYAGVSDVDLYHGNMRFDVNVSVSKDPGKPGIRAEVKNLNSFRSVEGAVEYEIKRQIELLEKGELVAQETRGWDDASQRTTSQRNKEEAEDYRYMPEPDIPPVELSDEFIEKIKKGMPILPTELRRKLLDIGLEGSSIDALFERNGEHGLEYIDRIFECLEINKELALFVAKHIVNDRFRLVDWAKNVTGGAEPAAPYLPTAKQFMDVFNLVQQGKLSSTGYKSLLTLIMRPEQDAEEAARSAQILQVSDEGAIEEIVRQVLAENQKAVEDVKNGEMKAIGFLVGQVMAKSKGQANPGLAQQIIKKQLGV